MENAYYWGKVTSRMNFGEPDYLWSPFVAELYNTCSNAAFFLLGCVGLYNSTVLPVHVRLAHLCMLVTGVASASFHATLQFEWHLFDEV
jgi:dihydroceramidase